MEFYINILDKNNENTIYKTSNIEELKKIIEIGIYNINCPNRAVIKEKINDKFHTMFYTYLNVNNIYEYINTKNNNRQKKKTR